MTDTDYPNGQYLTNPQSLQAMLQDPAQAQQLRLFDATVYLRPVKQDNQHSMSAASGLPEYNAAHIPGASFIDQLTQLSVADTELRFTLPPVDELAAAFAAAGISAEHHVVFYSSGHFMWSTRAWWLLSYCGHQQVSVLDGGLAAWQAAGFTTATEPSHYGAGAFSATPKQAQRHMFADTKATLAAMEDPGTCTINALPKPMYDGSSPIQYGRAGHIPGSKNLPYSELLHAPATTGLPAEVAQREIPLETLLPAPELKLALEQQSLLGAKPVITYCGGGIAATVPAFATRLMGKEQIAVYDGSMSEWSQDPNRPLVTGDG